MTRTIGARRAVLEARPSATGAAGVLPRPAARALVLAWTLAGALGLAGAAPPAARPPAPSAAPAQELGFGERVEVNVVNVEVYVTGPQGDRVGGLQKDDFELYEDGRPVAITNFYAVEAGRLTTPAPPALAPEAPAAAPPGAVASLPAEQRLYLVVYVDNFNIRPFNRNRVLRRVREFLTQNAGRYEEVMLVSYDRSLHVRRLFTSEPAAIVSALFELETVTGHALQGDSERREVVELLDEAEDPTDVSMRLRSYAESVHNDLLFSIDALKEVVSWVSGLAGRKTILYISDGLPMVPGQDLFFAMQQKFTQYSSLAELASFDTSRRFQELASLANSSRVTFYTLDAAGLRVSSSSSVQNFGLSSPGLSSFLDTMEISNLQAPLLFLAEQTGGLAILNTNDPGNGLARVAGDFDTFYSLGYSPAHAVAGRRHDLKVKLKRKGLTARYRRDYRDRTLETRLSDTTLSVLRFGFEENPLAVAVAFGEPAAKEDGHWLVPIVVEIPLDRIVLLPGAQSHEARLKLFVAALDEEGGTSPVAQQPLPISIPSSEVEGARREAYHYQLSLLMRGGPHWVAVGVRDELGATDAFVRKNVWVGR